MIWILLGLTFGVDSGLGQPLKDTKTAKKQLSQGVALYVNGDYHGAVRIFEEVITLNPKDPQAYYFLGYAYYQIQNLEKSREAFTQAFRMKANFKPHDRTSDNHEGIRP